MENGKSIVEFCLYVCGRFIIVYKRVEDISGSICAFSESG